jgi:DNA recombination protein RmuC
VQSVRRHLASLSSKNYQGLYKEQGDLDFVLLFMPIEPALLLALSKDEKLFTEAYNKNILLVNPSTLLLALRIVANLWRQEMQAQNVRDIADRGAKLYDKFRGFVEDLQKVGERLRQADESYQGALGKLSTGSGNLIHQAELLRDLGVKPKKTLPAGLVEAQNEEPQKPTS